MTKPLISFVIPTHNRASLVNQCIGSLVNSCIASGNTNQFEIVISNNFSKDLTKQILASWSQRFPHLIRGYNQPSLIKSAENLDFVLRTAKGDFIKPLNDKIIVAPRTAQILYMQVSKLVDIGKKTPLVFSNGHSNGEEWIYSYDMDALVLNASYIITWYGSLGIWSEHLLNHKFFTCSTSLYLPQVEYLLSLLEEKSSSIICNLPLFSVVPTRSSGYNVVEVFGRDYAAMLRKYVKKGILSKDTYNGEIISVFRNHCLPGYFDFEGEHDYRRNGFFEYTKHLDGIIDAKAETSSYLRASLLQMWTG